MNEKKIKHYYYLLFKILLFIAGLISIKNQSWTNLILVIITSMLIYMHKILKLRKKKSFPNKIEIFILVLIYVTIFIDTTTLIKISDLWFRISFYLLISFIIGTIGFLLIYILNNDENANLKLNPLFVSLFAFTFSITIATLWQIFRYSMNYIFQINIQNFNTSDSLGFITITALGAGIVSIIGYIYLKTDEDKNFIKNTFKFLGINKNSQKKKQIKIIKLISKGESKNLEFKETLR